MAFRQIGGSGGGTVNVPTNSTRTFDASNFGALRSDITSGTANNFGSGAGVEAALGTLTAAIDGFELNLRTTSNIYGSLKIFLDGVEKINWPINTQSLNIIKVPIPIRMGPGVLVAKLATNGNGSTGHIGIIPWQSSVQETITSWSVLGSQTLMVDQGTHFTAVTDLNAWKTLGTLGADAKAIGLVAYSGNDTSRTGSNEYVIDIGTGMAGNETVLVPKISASDTTTILRCAPSGPHRLAIASGTRIAGRVATEAGTLPDDVSLQAVVGY